MKTMTFGLVVLGTAIAGTVSGCSIEQDATTATATTAVTSGPQFSLSATSLSYGNVLLGADSQDNVRTIRLTKTSAGADLFIGSPSTNSPTNFSILNDSCSGSRLQGKGASCSFDLGFGPRQRGSISAVLSVNTNSTQNPPPHITLSGNGVGPIIGYSHTSIGFGNQPVSTRSAPKSLTITNGGNGPLNIGSVSIEGSGASNYEVDQGTDLCTGAALAQTKSCTVGIVFAPNSTGAANATVGVEHDAFVNPPSVSLSGNGT